MSDVMDGTLWMEAFPGWGMTGGEATREAFLISLAICSNLDQFVQMLSCFAFY